MMNNKPHKTAKKETPKRKHIDAPYNFVPLSKVVVVPEWGNAVSHDLPFKDGVSGEIHIHVKAMSNIAVGNGREPRGEEPARLNFCQLPDGRFAISGSTLRGMVRNVFEISTFSKMDAVDDDAFSTRDLSKGEAADVYKKALKESIGTGFLRKTNGQRRSRLR